MLLNNSYYHIANPLFELIIHYFPLSLFYFLGNYLFCCLGCNSAKIFWRYINFDNTFFLGLFIFKNFKNLYFASIKIEIKPGIKVCFIILFIRRNQSNF